ncbi:MAG: 4-(cytidine 5'-diphospho)-2-C-methyl-D-erythritol kinase, partial [Actinomycetota bacterium]|nr:4-(cytidine 5'-diphospho)-2-C-methyl-D-erythritol kinase [Actinomycetota bacterium]
MRAQPDQGARAHGQCVHVDVPAKINLFLAVRGRRPDGYHELTTVMQTVSLFDQLRASITGPPGRGQHPSTRRRMRVRLDDDGTAGLPLARDNLAVRAAAALGRATGLPDVCVDVSGNGAVRAGSFPEPPSHTVLALRKGIPVAAGMAGGSADAAAVLLGLNDLWDCGLSRDELRDMGGDLGSDVPFCVVGGTALCTGTGTQLARVLCRGEFHWVVGTGGEPLGTAEVYRAWDRYCRPGEAEPDAVLQALRTPDAEALGAALHNDLESAALVLRPELAGHRRALLRAGALGAVVSG